MNKEPSESPKHDPDCYALVNGESCSRRPSVAGYQMDVLTGRLSARVLLEDADQWIGRAGQFVNAVLVMANDETKALALLADMAEWNDRRKAFLGDE